MSVLISSASGNLTASGTWSLVDSASYSNSEAANTALTTSIVASSTFVPAATAIDAVAVKIASRAASPTGTMTVELFNSTGASIALTLTINVSDLPLADTTLNQGGWIVFKFGSTVTPNGTDSYSVRAKTSSAAQVNLYSTATTNWSRAVRNTTNQAPVAGDDMIIAGEHTGAGTGNNLTVTMNQTAATDYGSNTTSAVTPAMSISKRGTLAYGVAASTNYLLQLSGYLVVYGQGTLNIGTIGTEIPRTSTATLQFDVAVADGDFGLDARGESTVNVQGLSRTSAKNVVWTLLNSDAAANATTLNVADDTGWLSGDVIVVASSVRFATAEQSEKGALNGNASSSALTVNGFGGTAGAVAFAHDGTTGRVYTAADGATYPYSMQCEVILLTRNVVIKAVGTSFDTFAHFATTATVAISWAEFIHCGGVSTTTVGKRGIEFDTTTGSFSLIYCSIHDTRNHTLITNAQNAWNNATIQHCVFYNLNTAAAALALGTIDFNSSTAAASTTIDDLVVILTSTSSAYPMRIRNTKGTIGALRLSSCGAPSAGNQAALAIADNAAVAPNPIGPLVLHSNKVQASVLFLGANWQATISSLTSYRNAGGPWLNSASSGPLTITTLLEWGDNAFGLGSVGPCDLVVNGGFIASDTTYTLSDAVWWDQALMRLEMNNVDISPVQGILAKCTNDFACEASQVPFTQLQATLRNCLANSTNRLLTSVLNTRVSFADSAYISIERLGRTAGNHLTIARGGDITTDAVIFNTASPSMRMTPVSASIKLCSAPPRTRRGLKVPVSNGVAGKTISAWVRKSVSTDAGGANYNGNQQRLIQRANAALGQNSDVVLATAAAAVGTWEQLTGTLSTPTDDGAFEIIVDCDGTAGWINVDDFTAS